MKNHVEQNHAEAERGFPTFLTLSWAWHEAIEDPAAVKAALARNLRHYREQCCLSRKALAKACAIEPGDIRNIEIGLALPAIGVLVRLADALGTSCSALVESDVPPAAALAQRTRETTPPREIGAVTA